MPTYVVLCTFTDQGIRNAKDTTKRADAIKEMGSRYGVALRQILWTLGRYDVVCTFEAPNDEAMTAFSLAVGSQGNVHTQTLRAFTREEMDGVLRKLG